MSDEAATTLGTLKDLEGIVGSFLVNSSGSVIAQDLPSYFGSAAYDIGPRAMRLKDALSVSEGEVSSCIVRYGQHKLSLRPLKGALLTVVAQADVNLPALRMAMNLVARKLTELDVASVSPQTPAPPTVRPDSLPPRAPVGPSSAAPAQQERGSAAPEAGPRRPAKQRAVYFRGKRIR